MELTEELALLDLPKRAIALVLAGGRGSRLMNLTDIRAKPAVFFGGKYRIIDFALSNCLNSGIRRIGVITQYKSHSLLRHIQHGWAFMKPEMNEFVDLMPAQQRVGDGSSWYRGTADAVFHNIDILESYGADYIVVLAGDHVYKMNYAVMLADHVKKGRMCTVACIEVPRSEATAFGVMAVDQSSMITDFVEKPQNPPGIPGKENMSLASMGIYIFNAKDLYAELKRDSEDPNSTNDFGKDIIPRMVKMGQAAAHSFTMSCISDETQVPYWRDVGTIDSYWEANIDLTATAPQLNLYDRKWPIWTYQSQLPSAKFVHNEPDRVGMAIESIVSGGCIISGQTFRSMLFSSVRVHSYAKVNWSVLLPGVVIGRRAKVSKAIIDRSCVIPDGMVIGEDAELDAKRFYRSPGGVTLVTADMLAKIKK